jgi:chromosome segregation ATPase
LISESETEDSLFRESTVPSNPEEPAKVDQTPSESESMAIESYHRQNEVLSRRLMEREQELKRMEEEQEERINFISKQAEELEREIAARKKEVQDYKTREQLASQQIQELETQVTGLEHEQHVHRRDQALTKTQLEEKAGKYY